MQEIEYSLFIHLVKLSLILHDLLKLLKGLQLGLECRLLLQQIHNESKVG